jgi:putative ABC transport system permease protein
LSVLAAGLREEFPRTNSQVGFRLEGLLDSMVWNVRKGLWILLGAVGLMLLVVCANVSNLLLSRGSARGVEVGIRAALGATPLRLVGQLLVESLVLTAVGGAAGLLVCLWLIEGFKRASSGTFPRFEHAGSDATVLAFALGLSALVAVLSGLSPAVHLVRRQIVSCLARGRRDPSDRRESTARSWIMAGEVGVSVVLLITTGLLARSLLKLYQVDLGFAHREVLRFNVSLPAARYSDPAAIITFYQLLEERLRQLPGIASVGTVFGPLLTPFNQAGDIRVVGRPEPEPSQRTFASVHPATPGYFDTLGVALRRRRGIEVVDHRDAPAVAVVNEAFVRENFPDQDVLGAGVRVGVAFGAGKTWRVVGVAGDVRRALAAEVTPEIYVPLAQADTDEKWVIEDLRRQLGDATVHVRSLAKADRLLPAVRDQIAAMDPAVLAVRVETLREAIRRDAAPTRHYMTLVGLFAVLAILLAGVGLYGVVAYLVSRRTQEIAVRIALGADHPQLLWLVLRQAVTPTAWGLALGLAAALSATQVVESLLFQVKPVDPPVCLGVCLLVASISLVATLIPARRASRLDPVEALGTEEGDIVSIMGPSGAGRSTLLQGAGVGAGRRASRAQHFIQAPRRHVPA